MKSYIFLIGIYLSSYYITNAQTTTLIYDLIVSNKTIGTVKTTKTLEGNQTTYTSDTDATISFIIKTKITTRMTVVYKNDSLLSSDYKFYKNDNLKEYATVIIKEGKYILNHDGKKTEFKEGIKLSTILLPFEKPKNNVSYFEEVEGCFKVIKYENETLFKLINPKNNRNDDYSYKDGIMQKCVIRNSIVDFTMELKK
ncbi:hypothetical protein IMCC3317_15090 [Kordia antarctica]|uniref:Uncharacterized protein n=1 Tax=Kordia antarctica TaxID=1218801 RepID=A0A7L4ZI06_9FLAO|nr:DUF6134 family protein [Kordia antarctica]QHI36150.1 hypothetical protein IMCC3317_15090 [Kordia antarctica]